MGRSEESCGTFNPWIAQDSQTNRRNRSKNLAWRGANKEGKERGLSSFCRSAGANRRKIEEEAPGNKFYSPVRLVLVFLFRVLFLFFSAPPPHPAFVCFFSNCHLRTPSAPVQSPLFPLPWGHNSFISSFYAANLAWEAEKYTYNDTVKRVCSLKTEERFGGKEPRHEKRMNDEMTICTLHEIHGRAFIAITLQILTFLKGNSSRLGLFVIW